MYQWLTRAEDPYPALARLRAAEPVHFNPYARLWFLTRHADCLAVLRDPRFSAAQGQQMRRAPGPQPPSMLTTDPPEHDRLRAPVGNRLTRPVLEPLRERIGDVADSLLKTAANAAEMEVIGAFARPLVVASLCDLLGIPPSERPAFAARVAAASPILDPLATPNARSRAALAAEILRRSFVDMLRDRARRTRADLLSHLVDAADGEDALTLEELSVLANLLAIGGVEPTVHLIGNGLLTLLRLGEGAAEVREEPSLNGSGIDELLRFDSPIHFAARVATEDVEVGGVSIRAGQGVVTLLGAANRDPEVFASPDRLDLHRRPNPHLAFGAGVHFCVGASLARLCGEIALTRLLHRFPDPSLDAERLAWRPSLAPRGLEELWVRL